jgi:hypothetical protein
MAGGCHKPILAIKCCFLVATAAAAASQVAQAELQLQLLKSQLLLAQTKQQTLKLQIKYAQVRNPHTTPEVSPGLAVWMRRE